MGRAKTGLFGSRELKLDSTQHTRCSAMPNFLLPSELSGQGVEQRGYVSRRQYRVLYKEVCTTVGEVKTLGEVVDVPRQTLIRELSTYTNPVSKEINACILALQLMFCAGWVHRDISSGNIMAHRDSDAWQAKLGDLEYAKKYAPVNSEDRASIDHKTVRFDLVIDVSLPLTMHY